MRRWLVTGLVGVGLFAAACGSDDTGADGNGTAGSGGAQSSGSGGSETASSGGADASGGAAAGEGGSGGDAGAQTSDGGTDSSGGASAGAAGTGGEGGAVAGSGGAATGSGGSQPGTGICGAQEGQLFGSDHPWNQRVDQADLDAESDTIISYLQSNHTASARFRIDGPSDIPDNEYGIVILTADASTQHEAFNTTGDFYSPDCDPAPIPIPAVGAIEGESGYSCDNDGDCHLIVIDTANCRLHEMWRANRVSADDFDGGCQAVWDLTAAYTPTLRGDCCTSADAAGLPIAAHMVTADEIAAGRIEHAIRFILPNSLMRELIYVRPATHSTGATSGPAEAPPYGARMRLRADFDASGLNAAAQVVATALQEYGMILSDGGNITFTFANDRFTTAKWTDVGLMPGDLTSLEWSDFEVVELGTRYTWDNSCDCNRTPVTD